MLRRGSKKENEVQGQLSVDERGAKGIIGQGGGDGTRERYKSGEVFINKRQREYKKSKEGKLNVMTVMHMKQAVVSTCYIF